MPGTGWHGACRHVEEPAELRDRTERSMDSGRGRRTVRVGGNGSDDGEASDGEGPLGHAQGGVEQWPCQRWPCLVRGPGGLLLLQRPRAVERELSCGQEGGR